MIKAAVIGATGFTGSELIRILLGHPEVQLTVVTSESKAGKPLAEVYPDLTGFTDLRLTRSDDLDAKELDVLFLALPHRISMNFVKRWYSENVVIIDLSGDFRLGDASTYEQWYGTKHVMPEIVQIVPYGLPELNRISISSSKVVANPGCYPTASILALAPLIQSDLVDVSSIIIDAKSGLTGAGAGHSDTTHFSNVNDNFKAYGLKNHRHTIEIQEVLGGLINTSPIVQFTPHLLPVDRGILSTCYANAREAHGEQDLLDLYNEFYRDEPFVRICEGAPTLKQVRGTNLCDIHPTYDPRTGRFIVISVIDNLMKGAAGQAVQSMNIVFSFDETSGLARLPIQP